MTDSYKIAKLLAFKAGTKANTVKWMISELEMRCSLCLLPSSSTRYLV